MATTSSKKSTKNSISDAPKRKPGRPKAIFHITGEIVPCDTFGPNKNNPYERMTDLQRNEALEAILGDIIVQKVQKAGDESAGSLDAVA